MKHEIEIVISEDGQVSGVVQGVSGPACSDISKFLDSLGTVVVDSNTDDYYKPPEQGITIAGGLGG